MERSREPTSTATLIVGYGRHNISHDKPSDASARSSAAPYFTAYGNASGSSLSRHASSDIQPGALLNANGVVGLNRPQRRTTYFGKYEQPRPALSAAGPAAEASRPSVSNGTVATMGMATEGEVASDNPISVRGVSQQNYEQQPAHAKFTPTSAASSSERSEVDVSETRTSPSPDVNPLPVDGRVSTFLQLVAAGSMSRSNTVSVNREKKIAQSHTEVSAVRSSTPSFPASVTVTIPESVPTAPSAARAPSPAATAPPPALLATSLPASTATAPSPTATPPAAAAPSPAPEAPAAAVDLSVSFQLQQTKSDMSVLQNKLGATIKEVVNLRAQSQQWNRFHQQLGLLLRLPLSQPATTNVGQWCDIVLRRVKELIDSVMQNAHMIETSAVSISLKEKSNDDSHSSAQTPAVSRLLDASKREVEELKREMAALACRAKEQIVQLKADKEKEVQKARLETRASMLVDQSDTYLQQSIDKAKEEGRRALHDADKARQALLEEKRTAANLQDQLYHLRIDLVEAQAATTKADHLVKGLEQQLQETQTELSKALAELHMLIGDRAADRKAKEFAITDAKMRFDDFKMTRQKELDNVRKVLADEREKLFRELELRHAAESRMADLDVLVDQLRSDKTRLLKELEMMKRTAEHRVAMYRDVEGRREELEALRRRAADFEITETIQETLQTALVESVAERKRLAALIADRGL